MHATIRRYDGVDRNRTDELNKKVGESLVPKLRELPGFAGYYLIDAGNGVVTSIGFFEGREQADKSTLVAAEWVREQKLETLLPNAPRITSGEVIAAQNGVPVLALTGPRSVGTRRRGPARRILRLVDSSRSMR